MILLLIVESGNLWYNLKLRRQNYKHPIFEHRQMYSEKKLRCCLMDKKAIEMLSTSAIKDALAVSNFLDPFITDNDKEPSWDGHIYIYNNKNKKKENLKGRLPVQVKGTENNDFSKEEISYSMSVTDLTNYLYGGGAILFVVYVAHSGLAKQIYYSALPPVKIKLTLEKASGQKTKTIKLKKFPSLINEKERILFDCLGHCQMQASFSSAKLFSRLR